MYQISIIIPSFNVEKYIENCIKSLVMQTSKNFEVILIDDHSYDKTINIVESYRSQVEFPIRIYKNEKNIGAGETRNLGINKSKNKYLMFLDADDYLEINCIEKINNLLTINDWDYICFDYFINKGKIKNHCHSMNINKNRLTTKEALIYSSGTVWGKVFKSEIIKSNNIKFPNLNVNEDMVFTKEVISYCQKIIYLRKPLYHYVMRKTSLMHAKKFLDDDNPINAYKLLCKYINPRYKDILRILFVKEVLYSTVVIQITNNNTKEDILKNIIRLERKNVFWYKNVKNYNYSLREKIILRLIKDKKIYLLQIVVCIQNIAKYLLR